MKLIGMLPSLLEMGAGKGRKYMQISLPVVII